MNTKNAPNHFARTNGGNPIRRRTRGSYTPVLLLTAHTRRTGVTTSSNTSLPMSMSTVPYVPTGSVPIPTDMSNILNQMGPCTPVFILTADKRTRRDNLHDCVVNLLAVILVSTIVRLYRLAFSPGKVLSYIFMYCIPAIAIDAVLNTFLF
jgi:hypothetical protein